MKKRIGSEARVQHEFGVITVVQEGRFRLSSDDGRSILFALDRHASIEPQDLPSFLAGPRVGVAYSEAPGRKSLTAHDIRPAGAP